MNENQDQGPTEIRSRSGRPSTSSTSDFDSGRSDGLDRAEFARTTRADGGATIRLLEMSGPVPLDDASIDDRVIGSSPGNFALGYMDGDVFVVFYVGRSDEDLQKTLRGWIDMPSRCERYASSGKASWGRNRRGPLPFGSPSPGRVTNAETRYTHFAYSYASCSEEAFAKEWRNYDAFGGNRELDNGVDPTWTER